MPIITKTNLDITRERLTRPFGFKGGAFTEKWLTHVTLSDDKDQSVTGVGGLAVLWSDQKVFLEHTEVGGNMLMALVLEKTLQLAQNTTFNTPFDLLDTVLEPAYKYGQKISGNPALRRTFVLNALVALDNAAWLLYAKNAGIKNFDTILPKEYQQVLHCRHKQAACVPLISYHVPPQEIISLIQAGHFFLKIKIGAAGEPEQMLEKDKKRLKEIHEAISTLPMPHTDHTNDGHVRYYLDANGRYPNRQMLEQLLDFAKELGMFEQITVVEEPLAESSNQSLEGLGVMIAADESLHDPSDVVERAELGYSALALKPAGKTLSMTLRMAKEAHRLGLSCFVADSACMPISLDWNRNVAARLDPLSGLDMGLIESNGAQHYKNWHNMIKNHPCAGAKWLEPKDGMFHLDACFYKNGGGVFQ